MPETNQPKAPKNNNMIFTAIIGLIGSVVGTVGTVKAGSDAREVSYSNAQMQREADFAGIEMSKYNLIANSQKQMQLIVIAVMILILLFFYIKFIA